MKIEGGRGIGSANGTRRAGQTAAPGFAPATEAPQRTSAASATGSVAALDTILALQAEGFDPDRRRRQVKRGTAALDALEQLARGLAMGRAPATLRAELEGLRRGGETTGEGGLDSTLREIDTRLAVELAKLEMSLGVA
jgi:hypothetical protein